MMEDILKNLIQSNGENLLVNATEAVIKKSKDKTAWKKLFVNTGEFFIRQEQNAAEHIMDRCTRRSASGSIFARFPQKKP